jgi:short-subunit dehydrogenase
MKVKGKLVALTGGGGGIGSHIAKRLIARGARLVVIDRIETLPFEAEHIRGDLSTVEGIQDITRQLVPMRPDILINLAGVQYFGPLAEQSDTSIAMGYTINLVAPVMLSRAVLPAMLEAGGGQIVNVGSIFGSISFAHFATYSSAKSGLRSFSEALRRETTGSGVQVTYIAPRAVKTPLNTQKVLDYAVLTGMKMDEPESVARKIVTALIQGRKDVYLGFPESAIVRLNAILPRMVDGALRKNDGLARTLFLAPEPTALSKT